MTNQHFDQHLHSSFSCDSTPETKIQNIIDAAIAKQLSGIAITDHFDPLWPIEDFGNELDIPAYEQTLLEAEVYAADIGKDIGFRFAKGLEIGFIPGAAGLINDIASAFPFDFIIFSIHSSATMPTNFPEYHEGRSLAEILDVYYTQLLDGVKTCKDYDVLGHINSIDRYTDELAPEALYMPYTDEIMRLAIADGKGIELNMSSYRYGLAHRGTPTFPLLKRYKELGGEIVTLGSDAHIVNDIGAYIEKGEEILIAAGFSYVAYYKNRQPDFFKL